MMANKENIVHTNGLRDLGDVEIPHENPHSSNSHVLDSRNSHQLHWSDRDCIGEKSNASENNDDDDDDDAFLPPDFLPSEATIEPHTTFTPTSASAPHISTISSSNDDVANIERLVADFASDLEHETRTFETLTGKKLRSTLQPIITTPRPYDLVEEQTSVLDQLERENLEMREELTRAEQLMETEKSSIQQALENLMEEMKQHYERELERQSQQNDAALVEATKQAAQQSHQFQSALHQMQADFNSKIESEKKDKDAALESMRRTHLSKIVTMQQKYDQIETELLEALDYVQELQQERDEVISSMQEQVFQLQSRLAEAEGFHRQVSEQVAQQQAELMQSRDKALQAVTHLEVQLSTLRTEHHELVLSHMHALRAKDDEVEALQAKLEAGLVEQNLQVATIRAVLQEQAIADQVELFRKCRGYYEQFYKETKVGAVVATQTEHFVVNTEPIPDSESGVTTIEESSLTTATRSSDSSLSGPVNFISDAATESEQVLRPMFKLQTESHRALPVGAFLQKSPTSAFETYSPDKNEQKASSLPISQCHTSLLSPLNKSMSKTMSVTPRTAQQTIPTRSEPQTESRVLKSMIKAPIPRILDSARKAGTADVVFTLQGAPAHTSELKTVGTSPSTSQVKQKLAASRAGKQSQISGKPISNSARGALQKPVVSARSETQAYATKAVAVGGKTPRVQTKTSSPEKLVRTNVIHTAVKQRKFNRNINGAKSPPQTDRGSQVLSASNLMASRTACKPRKPATVSKLQRPQSTLDYIKRQSNLDQTAQRSACHSRIHSCTKKSGAASSGRSDIPTRFSTHYAPKSRSMLPKYAGYGTQNGPSKVIPSYERRTFSSQAHAVSSGSTKQQPGYDHASIEKMSKKETPSAALSPSELLDRLLDSLSPPRRHSTTPQKLQETPRELIDFPDDLTTRRVDSKFESLFTAWSTVKKQPGTAASHPESHLISLPSTLFFDSTTSKKQSRDDDYAFTNPEAIVKRARCSTELAKISCEYTTSTPATRSVALVDSFSPEELLVSPPPNLYRKGTLPPVSDMKALSLDPSLPFFEDQPDYEPCDVPATIIQTLVRCFLARRQLAMIHQNEAHPRDRVYGINHLFEFANNRNDASRVVQSCFRRYKSKKYYQRMKSAAIVIQACCRRASLLKKVTIYNRAASSIQRLVRIMIARRKQIRLKAKLNDSAVLLQGCWRTQRLRLIYAHFRGAIIVIQANHRRRSAIQRLHRQVSSAVSIQSWWQTYLVRNSYTAQRLAARRVQDYFRRYSIRQASRLNLSTIKAMRTSASLILQRSWRGTIVRKYYKEQLRALLTIQAVARRLIARNSFHTLLATSIHCKRDNAASVIQQQWRFAVLRSHYRYQTSALVIQRVWRGFACRSEYLRCCVAISVILAFSRGVMVRREFVKLRHAAVIVQSAVRFSNRRHLRARWHSSAVMIQKHWRRLIVRKEYVKAHRSIIKSQSALRAFFACRYADSRRRAVLLIQSNLRGALVRLGRARTREAVIFLQRFVRRRTTVCRRQCAAQCIQQQTRCFLARLHYQKDIRTVIKLQSVLRSVAARKQVRQHLVSRASVTIQRFWRARAARIEFLFYLDAVMVIQATVRRFISKKVIERLTAENRAATIITIQRHARSYLQRKRYSSLLEKVSVVQSTVSEEQTRIAIEKANDHDVAQETPSHQTTTDWESEPDYAPSFRPVLGDVTTSLKSKPRALRLEVQRRKNSNTNQKTFADVASVPTVSPMKTRRGAKIIPQNAENRLYSQPISAKSASKQIICGSALPSREDIEKLRVLDLRGLLVQHGVQVKELRNIRKAGLVDLVLEYQLRNDLSEA